MTYRERMQKLMPKLCDPAFLGGCAGCPPGPIEVKLCCNLLDPEPDMCSKCWDQEIPEEGGEA